VYFSRAYDAHFVVRRIWILLGYLPFLVFVLPGTIIAAACVIVKGVLSMIASRKEIGDRVRQVRGRLTQQEFADKLQLSRSYISDVERGRSYPSIQFLAALAVTCDISLNWLLTGEGTDRKASYSLVKEGQEEDTLRQLTESLGDLYDGANRDWQGWVKIELSQLIETLQRANR